LEPQIKGGLQTDSTGNKITGGLQVSTNLFIEKWLFLKSLLFDQSLSLDWKRMNGHTSNHPDVSYDFTVDILIIPNIKLKTNGVVSYEDGVFSNFTGKLISTIIF
jgi:hypothetical protein